MDSLKQARERLQEILDRKRTDRSLPVQVHPLDPDEAIGKDADPSFAIKKGKERVIEATFQGHKGQAFTEQGAPITDMAASPMDGPLWDWNSAWLRVKTFRVSRRAPSPPRRP